jgi:hypothetical protein
MPYTNIIPHDENLHGPFGPVAFPERGSRVVCDGPDGAYHAYLVNDEIKGESLVVPNATWTTAMAPIRIAAAAFDAKIQGNQDRLRTLGTRWARFAKDPAANTTDNPLAGGNGRAVAETLARLCLAASSEDV